MSFLNTSSLCNNFKKLLNHQILSKIKPISSISSKMIATHSPKGQIPGDVYEILHQVAENEGMQMPYFIFRKQNVFGQGYMGDLFYVTIQNQLNPMKRDVVVKRALECETVRSDVPVTQLYSNECHFYDTMWPIFVRFQNSALGGELFTEVPKCYQTNLEPIKEKLVLENLKVSNFQNVCLDQFMDNDHFELIFNTYGKFHGLSLAYKARNPSNFKKMTDGLYDYMNNLKDMTGFRDTIRRGLSQCTTYLEQESEGEILEVFQKYVEKGAEEFCLFTKYHGEHSVLLHGDCWSNNIMFKYNESRKPSTLRFVDFQMARLGTPVFDLSYCLYSGASKEVYEELDYYLGIYHESLSSTLQQYGYESTEIYPLETLREEWKIYSKFGFIMGLLLLKRKCLRKDEIVDMSELIKNAEERKKDPFGRYHQDKLKQTSLDLVRHMYRRGFL